MAASVRPSLSPITRVGVSCLANLRSCAMSAEVQGFPVFRVDFVGIMASVCPGTFLLSIKADVLPRSVQYEGKAICSLGQTRLRGHLIGRQKCTVTGSDWRVGVEDVHLG